MTITNTIKEEIDRIFTTHTRAQIARSMFEDYVELMKKFDKQLWKKIIDEGICLDDGDLCYVSSDYKPELVKFKNAFCWFCPSIIPNDLPWQEDERADFPTSFMLIKHNDKFIVLTVMIGQGTAVGTTTLAYFTGYDFETKSKYEIKIDKDKFITLDDLEKTIKESYKAIEKTFYEPDGTLAKPTKAMIEREKRKETKNA